MEFDKMEDLNASISFTRDGLEIGSKNDHALQHPSTADCMTNMFLDLGIRYDRTLRIQDLMESVSIGKEALREMPETLNSSTRACRLTAFAVLANKRFEYTKTNDDLDSALHAVRAALKLTSSDDQQLPFRLDLLGECLFKRSQWTGRTDELDEAVEQLDRAVELTPDADMDIYHRLRNLSYAFTERYLQSRRLVDLEDAYRIGRKALRLIPEGSVDRSLFCSQMSQVLHLKAERLDSLETLQQSIDLQRQALNSGCINNRQRAGLYSTLGGLLVNRFVKSNNTKDLERGIELHRKANAAISDDDVTLRCLTLHGLGGALALKYDNTQNLMDLEEAILSTEMALKFTSPDKPNYASELAHLALMYSSSGTEERQQHALRLYLNSFSAKNASPTDRLGSAWGALRLWRQLKVHPDAKHMCCEAVQLMAFQCNRTLNQADQQRHISSFPTLTARACSLLLSVGGCLVEAINILEVGRSIILGYIINDHTDISDLQASYPQHARKYIKLVEDVNRQYPDTEGAGTQAARTNRRIQAVYELNQSVEEIRQLPGYDRFLRGPTVNQLKHYAREGTVVIVLVSEISSHAIVISTAGVESIELSSLTAREVSDWLGQDLTRFSHRQEDGKRNKRYLQFLLWIWKSCVRLVLDYLGLLEDTPPSHPRNLPRIWWIGAGFASSLPFHAAGDHSAGSFDNTLSRAISSYAPTVKALSYAREQCGRRRSQDSPRLLYVAMPTTPAAKPLPGVNKEEQAIREAIGDTFSFQSLTLPDSETVMQKMKRCEVIHFACHGVSNPVDPSKSCLLLQTNGKELNDGPIVDKLTVQQISEMHLPGGNIAYLSACSTAENKAHFLADEALHIASAFQAAGFSHVIGTLWPVYDTVSADVASNFYSEIRYATSMGDKRVAASLHRSLLLVREKLRNRPLAWAGYIHVGA
ncbi:CHAT domain-containing protein [Aspergillus californicus]